MSKTTKTMKIHQDTEYTVTLKDMKVGKTYKDHYHVACVILYKDDKKIVIESVSSGKVFVEKFTEAPHRFFAEVKPKRKAILRVMTNGVNIWSTISVRNVYKGNYTVLYEHTVEVEGNLRFGNSARYKA